MTNSFKSFKALAAYVAVESNRADVKAADGLRRSRPLAGNRKPGSGPRVARSKGPLA